MNNTVPVNKLHSILNHPKAENVWRLIPASYPSIKANITLLYSSIDV